MMIIFFARLDKMDASTFIEKRYDIRDKYKYEPFTESHSDKFKFRISIVIDAPPYQLREIRGYHEKQMPRLNDSSIGAFGARDFYELLKCLERFGGKYATKDKTPPFITAFLDYAIARHDNNAADLAFRLYCEIMTEGPIINPLQKAQLVNGAKQYAAETADDEFKKYSQYLFHKGYPALYAQPLNIIL